MATLVKIKSIEAQRPVYIFRRTQLAGSRMHSFSSVLTRGRIHNISTQYASEIAGIPLHHQ